MTTSRKPARRIGVINEIVATLTKIANKAGNPISAGAMRARLSTAFKNAGERSPSDIMTSIVETPVRGQATKSPQANAKAIAIAEIDAQIKALKTKKAWLS